MSMTREQMQSTRHGTIRVLIVEDEAMVADLLKDLLCNPGRPDFSCAQTETLAESLAFLKQNAFDAVLLDLGLPDSSGLDTARAMRKEFPSLPIVVLTGLADEVTAVQSLNLDIQDYLVKGQMNPALLSRSIRYAIDRKRSVDALKQSEAQARQSLAELQNLYDTALVGLCLTDRDHRYIRINKRLAEIDGLPPEKIIGRTFREVIPGIAHEVEEACDRVFETGEPVENQEVAGRMRPEPERERIWLESHYPLKDAAGKVVAVNTVVQEITERKQAEIALRESEERYRALVYATSSVVWRTSPNGETLHELTSPLAHLQKQEKRQLKAWLDFIHPADRERTIEAWTRAVANGELFEIENRNLHPDRTYHHYISRAVPVRDEAGRIREWIGSSVDITARKRAEEALRESEHRLDLATRAANEGVWDWDVAGGAVVTNEIYTKRFGAPGQGEDFLQWWTEHIHPDDRDRVVSTLRALAEGIQDSISVEYRFQCPDGSWCHIYDRAKAVAVQNGKTARVIGVMLDITERKRVEEELRVSEQRFREVFDHAPIGILLADLEGRYQHVNNAFCWIVGYSREELLRGDFDLGRLTHPDDLEATVQGIKKLLSGEVPVFFIEKRYLRKDGSTIWVRVSASLRHDAQGKPSQIVGLVEDIRERKQAEQALRESEERFRTLADNIAQLAWMADRKGRISWYNKRWFDYTGTSQEEMRRWGWKKVHHPEHLERVITSFREAVLQGEEWEDTFPLRGRDGEYRWFLSRAIPIRNEQGKVVRWFGTNTDITERRQMEEEVRHLAQHDALTGLPNRRLFSEIIRVELAQARRNNGKVAILFLDLDRFKEINDTLGHETGDELLKQTAVRLRGVIRTSDSVARIGGDEFNVLIPDMSCPEYAVEVAQKILNDIRRPFLVNGHELAVSTSIGISVFPDDGEEIDTLMRYADIAMYYAKEHGRNMYQFYNPVINTRSLERIRFETSLRQAIDHDEFVLYYQPLVDIATRRMVSVEVLLRWKHPEQGLLEPGRFFDAADEIGFMPEIDDWVLRTAGSQLKAWMDEGAGPVCVTVNVSKRQFESHDLLPRLASILNETGLPPECLDIEITEATAMDDTDRTIARLGELTAIGIHVSIDNFGVGYSSLNILKRMQVRKLKIDRSFIHDIPRDPDDRAIIAGVMLMAHSMKMKVVASGVEADEQLSFLREAHCDEAQGYLFGEPMPADRFRRLLAA